MKRISYWAKNHKQEARIAIVISYIFINLLAIVSGYLLRQIGILLLPSFLIFGFAIFIATVIIYPSKYRKGFNLSHATFYDLQKTCDFIIVSCAFCFIFYLSNRPENLFRFYPQVNAYVINHPSKERSEKPYKSIGDFNASLKDKDGNLLKWKERKKLLKEQVRSIKKDNNLSKGTKTILIILSVIVAIGLIALVAGLSCSLSCDGSGAAAAIVGIGGTALVVFLLILAIRAISGKKRRKRSEKPLPVQE